MINNTESGVGIFSFGLLINERQKLDKSRLISDAGIQSKNMYLADPKHPPTVECVSKLLRDFPNWMLWFAAINL